MANVLTDLFPALYSGIDKVSREMIGFIPAVLRDSSIAQAAKDEIVRVPVVPAEVAIDVTPAVSPPDDGDVTIANVPIQITKFRAVPIRFTGEEEKGLSNAGTMGSIMSNRVAQAIRTITNEVELDIAGLYTKASRADGAAGTTPFATADVLSDLAEPALILDDNGCPTTDRQLVLSNAAIANIRAKQSSLFKVSEAGREDLLRDGMTDRLQAFAIRQSGQVLTVVKGTGTSYIADGAAVVGDTTISIDTGSGTVVAGDNVTFSGDSNIYVVTTGIAAPGDIVIAEPGLLEALADSAAMTIGTGGARMMAFDRGAIALATRIPAVPAQGDLASDRTIIQDPVTGLAFEFAYYPQFRQGAIFVALAWGFELVKPEHVAILLG